MIPGDLGWFEGTVAFPGTVRVLLAAGAGEQSLACRLFLGINVYYCRAPGELGVENIVFFIPAHPLLNERINNKPLFIYINFKISKDAPIYKQGTRSCPCNGSLMYFKRERQVCVGREEDQKCFYSKMTKSAFLIASKFPVNK